MMFWLSGVSEMGIILKFVSLRGILMIVRYRVVLEMVWLIVSYSLVMMNYMRLLIVDVVL